MIGWISSALDLLGSVFGMARKNQDVINSPEVVRGKEAEKDAKELDRIHDGTQKGDIEKARDDFSH